MKFARLSALAVAAAATVFVGSASAIPIDVTFNVAAFGTFTSDTGSVTTANTITNGAPTFVGAILSNNVGLVVFQPLALSPNPMGVTLGSVFHKEFTTAMGTFLETLTVTTRTPTANALSVLAVGTIVQTFYISGPTFDPTPVYWSAAYTQNGGAGTQINGSFNNSTVRPPTIPEPTSLALVGLAMVGLAFARKAKQA